MLENIWRAVSLANRLISGLLLGSLFLMSHSVQAKAVEYDLNGDGLSDIGWRNLSTGVNFAYAMDGNVITKSYKINQVATDWYMVGSGDFDNDGTADLLWRNAKTGLNYIYLMDQFGIKMQLKLSQVSKEWNLAAIGDFNQDGTSDLYWHNANSGENYLYLIKDGAIAQGMSLMTLPVVWHPIGAGDFNGDGNDDIVWRNSETGANYLHLMQNGEVKTVRYLNTVADLNWKIAAIADLDGNGTDDIVWRHGTNGNNYIYKMENGMLAQGVTLNRVADTSWSIAASGDYNGDGQADLLWRNRETGLNYIYLMQNFKVSSYSLLNKVPDQSWIVMGAPLGSWLDVPPHELPIYIRGSLRGDVDDWSARPENLLVYQGNNIYTLEKDLYQGTILQFKAAGANWEKDGSNYNCGGVGELTLNVKAMGECGAVSDTNFVSIPENGTYRFTVDFSLLLTPIFEVDLVEAKELHAFGEPVGEGVANALYFVSPELTSGIARSRAEFVMGKYNTFFTAKILLDVGVYTFFVQDPSGTVERFGGNQTSVIASTQNSSSMEEMGVALVANSNEMITLHVEQKAAYYIGLDLRNGAAKIGFSTEPTTFCDGTCFPSNFGEVVTSDDGKAIYLRGDLTGDDWAAREQAKFKKFGSLYILNIPQLRADTYTFLFGSLDWSTWACGLPKGDSNASLIIDGESRQGRCQKSDNDDAIQHISATFQSQNDYTFILDMSDPVNPTFQIVTGIVIEPREDIWLRGSIINNDWTAVPEGQLFKLHGSDIYYVTLTDVIEGDYEFKFADAEWTNINCGGFADDSEIIVGQPLKGTCDVFIYDGAGPMSLYTHLPSDGVYTFVMDYNNPEQPEYQIMEGILPPPLDIYIRGTLIDYDWSASPEGKMQRIGLSNIYDLQLELKAESDYQFHIAQPEWDPINCSALNDANNTVQIDGEALSVDCNPSDGNVGNIHLSIPTDGTYMFTIDMSNLNEALLSVKSVVE